jgi:TonB family protein
LNAQSDTIFVNASGVFCGRDQASRYRFYSNDYKGSLVKEYDMKGQLRRESRLSALPPSEVKDGLTTEYLASGEKVLETTYSRGLKSGVSKAFYPDGKVSFEGSYENDKPINIHYWYFTDGLVRRKEEFANGKMTKGECYTKLGMDTTYFPAEQMAVFPGDLNKYLSHSIKYPRAAQEKEIEGKVFLKFVVEKDGSIKECKVIRSVDPLLDAEAVRLVMEMPRWEPAKQEGKPVRIEYNLPVNFKLQ